MTVTVLGELVVIWPKADATLGPVDLEGMTSIALAVVNPAGASTSAQDLADFAKQSKIRRFEQLSGL